MGTWYFAQGQERKGPETAERIRDLIGAGALHAGSPVWKQGFASWVRLDTTELSEHLSGPPPIVAEAKTRRHEFNFTGLPERFHLDQTMEAGFGLSKTNMQAIGHVATKTNGMAFVAIVLAILGFFTFVTFLPAIVCGHLALSQYRREPAIGGETMAKAALGMSYAVVGLMLSAITFFIVLGNM